jgi:hypothetical protein
MSDFKAEYAKSGRASCKGCKGTISQDSLRLAVMVQVSSAPLNFFIHSFIIYLFQLRPRPQCDQIKDHKGNYNDLYL